MQSDNTAVPVHTVSRLVTNRDQDVCSYVGTGLSANRTFTGRITRISRHRCRSVVRRSRSRPCRNLALDDIDSVRLTQSWWQRATGTSTVQVLSRRNGSSVKLANIHHGPQLALILQLRATELFGDDSKGFDAGVFSKRARAWSPVASPPASRLGAGRHDRVRADVRRRRRGAARLVAAGRVLPRTIRSPLTVSGVPPRRSSHSWSAT